MHTISSYHDKRPTTKQKNTQTDRGDYNTLRSLALSVKNEVVSRQAMVAFSTGPTAAERLTRWVGKK